MTGLAAQARISLPWTPVPITGQTFAVLLAGVVLGKWWGGISQAIYVAIGIAGVPWFAGWSGGHTAIVGPSGGYIIGFVLAALFLGHCTDRYVGARRFLPLLVRMLLATFVLIHIPGLVHLGIWLHVVKGTSPTLWQLLVMGTIPFALGDVATAAAAAATAEAITPKQAYNGEADAQRPKKWRIL